MIQHSRPQSSVTPILPSNSVLQKAMLSRTLKLQRLQTWYYHLRRFVCEISFCSLSSSYGGGDDSTFKTKRMRETRPDPFVPDPFVPWPLCPVAPL